MLKAWIRLHAAEQAIEEKKEGRRPFELAPAVSSQARAASSSKPAIESAQSEHANITPQSSAPMQAASGALGQPPDGGY
eukprot:921013-Pelagomonas_calceolata.AAC.1